MSIPPTCKFCADLNELGRFKPYQSCETDPEADVAPCGACMELEKVEGEIAQAMKVVEGLFERHRQVRTKLNQAHDPLIQKVPLEITSYIFQLAMPLLPRSNNLREMTAAELQGPTIVSAVCKAWRQVALSTPQLWTFSRVSLSSKKKTKTDFQGRCEFIRERLNRSGRLPITFCLTAEPYTHTFLPAVDMVRDIIQCSDRWRVLDLKCDTHFISLFSGKPHLASALHSLRLTIWGSIREPLTLLNAQPQDIYLEDTGLEKIELNWSQMRSGHLFYFKSNEYARFLELAPRIERCCISSVQLSWSDVPILLTPITHTTLQELILDQQETYLDEMNRLLCNFTFPALRSLTYPAFDTLTDAVLQLLKRSSCFLKELTVTEHRGRQVLRVLQEAPSLQRLICRTQLEPNVANEILRALVTTANESNSGATSLPDLEHVELTVESPDEVDWPLFAKAISTGGKLHTVKVAILARKYSRYRPDQCLDLESLRQLQNAWKAGLNLQLSVHPEGNRAGYDVIQATLDPEGWQHITEQWEFHALPIEILATGRLSDLND